jgi:hypothetical protein
MSWDVLLINSAMQVDIDSDDYPEFTSRMEFIEKVSASIPESDWSDPTIGIVDSDLAVMEFEVGDEEEIGATVLVNIYGGENPVEEIARLCKENQWQAYDIASESYIDLDTPVSDTWNAYQASREQFGEDN